MIDAFKKLVDGDAAGWQLHLAGSVGSPEELKRLEASATGYPIVFHPDASWQELRGLYEQASLFWHAQGFEEDLDQRPEAQEHFGITVVEALGAGLIPLVYDAAGPAEIVGSLPSASTWRTQEELVSLTRAKLALSELDAAHERAVAITRATDFADQAFREHLTTLIEGGAAR